MVDNIYQAKNQILERIMKDLQERGAERINVDEMGMLVDMVKDLAEAEKQCWEAEYFRSVTESMNEDKIAGYSNNMYGYDSNSSSDSYNSGNNNRSGWQNQYGSGRNSSRRGYNYQHHMGHTDMVQSIEMAMQKMNPAERERMRERLKSVMEM